MPCAASATYCGRMTRLRSPLVLVAAVTALLLGLLPAAQADDTVELTPRKGLIVRATVSYDGAAVTTEMQLRPTTRKRAELYFTAIDTGGGPGAERFLYVDEMGAAELEDENLVLVQCDELTATFARRSFAASIPVSCLGDVAPDRVRAMWSVTWERRVEGVRRCGAENLPKKGARKQFTDWVAPLTARRGC